MKTMLVSTIYKHETTQFQEYCRKHVKKAEYMKDKCAKWSVFGGNEIRYDNNGKIKFENDLHMWNYKLLLYKEKFYRYLHNLDRPNAKKYIKKYGEAVSELCEELLNCQGENVKISCDKEDDAPLEKINEHFYKEEYDSYMESYNYCSELIEKIEEKMWIIK
jgi:hypothetical protein